MTLVEAHLVLCEKDMLFACMSAKMSCLCFGYDGGILMHILYIKHKGITGTTDCPRWTQAPLGSQNQDFLQISNLFLVFINFMT